MQRFDGELLRLPLILLGATDSGETIQLSALVVQPGVLEDEGQKLDHTEQTSFMATNMLSIQGDAAAKSNARAHTNSSFEIQRCKEDQYV